MLLLSWSLDVSACTRDVTYAHKNIDHQSFSSSYNSKKKWRHCNRLSVNSRQLDQKVSSPWYFLAPSVHSLAVSDTKDLMENGFRKYNLCFIWLCNFIYRWVPVRSEQIKIVMKSCLHAIHNNIFLLIIPNQIAHWPGGKIHKCVCQGILMSQAGWDVPWRIHT